MDKVTDSAAVLPFEHYKVYVKEDTRPDGRELGEIRKITLDVGSIHTANGSALVQLGNTTVVCGIKAELTKPTADQPGTGIVVPNVELPPLCASHFKSGPPSEHAQTLSKFLDELIKTCDMIDLEKLCVCRDKLVWVLFCDIICLNYDGNLKDACVVALVASLRNAVLAEVKYDEESEKVTTNPESKIKVVVRKSPVSTTFVLFDSTYLLVDPTYKEELITDSELTVVTDELSNVCQLYRPGGIPLSEERIEKCIERAIENGKKIQILLNEILS